MSIMKAQYSQGGLEITLHVSKREIHRLRKMSISKKYYSLKVPLTWAQNPAFSNSISSKAITIMQRVLITLKVTLKVN